MSPPYKRARFPRGTKNEPTRPKKIHSFGCLPHGRTSNAKQSGSIPGKQSAASTPPMAGCCVFLRWPSTSHSRLGYRSLDADTNDPAAGPSPATTVTVVVGKERRVFAVDQLVLDSYPFRVLLETAVVTRKEERRGRAIFVDVDAILFEHILWLACDGRSLSQLLQLDLKEIIEFYAQDA